MHHAKDIDVHVEKAGIAPDVTIRLTAHKQAKVHTRESPWL